MAQCVFVCARASVRGVCLWWAFVRGSTGSHTFPVFLGRLQKQRESLGCLAVTFLLSRRLVVRHLFALVRPQAEKANLPQVCAFLRCRCTEPGEGVLVKY